MESNDLPGQRYFPRVAFDPFADEEDFDIIYWLNSIFEDQDDGHQRRRKEEKTLANDLIHRLQLMVEQTNHSLQDTAQQMSFSIPKVMGAADILYGEAAELAQQVAHVRTKLTAFENYNGTMFENLAVMDRAKCQLQDMYQALQEANNWSVLSVEVEEVFESGDIDQISMKISSMQKSLELLTMSHSDGGSIDLSDKIQNLELLKDRFEKMLRPVLEDAFYHYSDTIEQYYEVFKDLKRDDQFVHYYQENLRKRLLKEWSTQVKLDTDGTVLDKLNFLYDRLTMLWRTEMNFFIKIVYHEDQPKAVNILMSTFAEILGLLYPSIETLIREQLDQRQSQPPLDKLKLLIELKHFTNGFVDDIEKFILPPETYPYLDLDRALLAAVVDQSLEVEKFCRQLYQPFRNLHPSYLAYERERLDQEYQVMLEKYDQQDACVNKLFSLIRDSFKMYDRYVEFYPLAVVVDVHKWILMKYVQQLVERNGNVIEDEKGTSQRRPDWSRLQKTLLLFQTLGDFFNQLLQYRTHVHVVMKAYRKREMAETEGKFRRFDVFILDLSRNERLKALVYLKDENGLLVEVYEMATKMLESVAIEIYEIMSHFVKRYLEIYLEERGQKVVAEEAAQDVNEPSSPSEYITQIGQYLLMFPQHLEPFNVVSHDGGTTITTESPALTTAMKQSYRMFTIHMPVEVETSQRHFRSFSELLIECLLHVTMSEFMDHILRFDDQRIGDRRMRKQIAIDLEYLSAVCDDLGMNPGDIKRLAAFIQIFNDTETLPDIWLQRLRGGELD